MVIGGIGVNRKIMDNSGGGGITGTKTKVLSS